MGKREGQLETIIEQILKLVEVPAEDIPLEQEGEL